MSKQSWPRAAAIVTIGVLTAALLGSPPAVAASSLNAWTQAGGGQGHDGVNPGEGVLSATTVGRLAPSWTLSTGSLHHIPGTTTARVVSGTAYVVADDDTVYALNSHTGVRRWTTTLTGTDFFQMPVVQDGVVVVAASCCVISGSSVVGLDAATGTVLWTRTISALSNWSATGSSLFLGADIGVNPSLTRIDLHTGLSLWTVTSSNPNDFGWDLTALDGNLLISEHLHGFVAASIEARRMSDGTLVWTSALPGDSPVAHGLAIAGHTIYVAYFGGDSDMRLRALKETGRVRWDIRVGSPTFCDNLNSERPSVSGGLVLLPCGERMSAYSTATGHVRWTKLIGSFVSNAAIANGVWYAAWTSFGASRSRLAAFRLTNGQRLWSTSTARSILDLVQEEGPAVAEGRVFWSFDSTRLRTFALR
jgi:outer membrane protein assembly factor BamB